MTTATMRTFASPRPVVLPLLALLLLLSAVVAEDVVRGPSPAVGRTVAVDWFEVDLARAPEDRWHEVISKHKNDVLAVFHSLVSRVPKNLLPVLEDILDSVEHFWPLQLRQEMVGVAQQLGVAPGLVLAANLYYELNSGCTSIVAQHPNGTFFHGRNLDYGVPGLNKIAINVRFVNSSASNSTSNRTLYQGTTYAGFIGLLTGMKQGAFSLSIDERDTKNGSVVDNAIEAIFKGGHSIGFFFRETLETAADFDEALQRFHTTHMDSPSYMILAGVNAGEGAVVTRERQFAVDTWRINNTEGRWFLVETNYDHWKPPPPSDNRRDPAVQHMNEIDRNTLSHEKIYSVMSMFPNLNRATTYTAVMSAGTGVYYSYTQNNVDT